MTLLLKEAVKNYLSLYSLLFLIYAAGFTLISSLLNYNRLLKKNSNDFKASMLYFACFSLLLLIIPVVSIFLYSLHPFEELKKLGLQLGNYKLGLKVILVSIPICAFSGYIASNDPKLKKHYPFSKNACRSLQTFVIYEISYFFLYYLAWEFTFRGVFLFSIAGMAAYGKAGILIAISVQTIISTVYHLGHPETEVISAFAGGIIFGVIAYLTKSFLYTLFIHALIGILNDTFLYVRYYRKK